MNLINIASSKLKAHILQASSTDNEALHPPDNTLDENKDSIWLSGEGLPQYLLISLEEVEEKYQNIVSVSITCKHDYETNPKTVEVWVALSEDDAAEDQFIHWAELSMAKKRGTQMFSIDNIPESYKIIKLMVTETYGQFQTYLNQVCLLAEPDHFTSQSLFNQQDWNEPRGQLRHNQKRKKKFASPSQMLEEDEHSPDPLQIQNLDEMSRRSSFRKQIEQQNESKSLQKNAAMLTISKNMILIEDNLEDLNRRVEILEKKVDYSYQSLERNILKKVEDLVEKKIQRQFSDRTLNNKLRTHHDLGTSRATSKHPDIGRPVKTKENRKSKDQRIMELARQLEYKLQERARKVRKLRSKEKQVSDQYFV